MECDYYQKLRKAKEYYFSLRYISCPNLSGTPIYFNRRGFRHFLRKDGGMRPVEDQLRRFGLLRYVESVISSKKSQVSYQQGDKFRFCQIVNEVEQNYLIKVVAIEGKDGRLCFFSIMDSMDIV